MTKTAIPPDAFGARLRAARELRSMTQVELAEKAGITSTEVARYEGGTRKPGTDSLRSLCRAAMVSADYLLGLSERVIR